MADPISAPQGFKELFQVMQESTRAVEQNTAMLEELLRGPVIGAVLLLGLTVILYAWSWHLSRDVAVRGEKYRMLSAVGVLVVFVTALGAFSVHVAVVERPALTTVLVNLCVFVPFLLLGGFGYGFDRLAVVRAAGGAAAALDTPQRTFVTGLSAALVVAALGHVVRRTDVASDTAQVVVLAGLFAVLIVLLGVVWIRVR